MNNKIYTDYRRKSAIKSAKIKLVEMKNKLKDLRFNKISVSFARRRLAKLEVSRNLFGNKIRLAKATAVVLIVIVLPLVLIGGVKLIQNNNIFKNATIVSQSQTFNSYESPRFKVYLNENDESLGLIQKAIAAVEPSIEATVLSDGELTNLKTIVEKEKEGVYSVSLEQSMGMTPGDYTLEATLSNSIGERTIAQDFTWGVLALNPNKAVYNPGETSKISIGVIDEKGEMVCGAKIKLKVESPKSKVIELTSENGDIKVHPQCESYEYSEESDITTSFEVEEEGEHKLTLTAVTDNGT